jgi:hypothetical protein
MAEAKATVEKVSNIEAYQRSLSEDERRESAIRAGKASGEARGRRRLFRETLGDLMRSDAVPEEIKTALEATGAKVDIQSAILFAAARRAMLGDVEAARFVRDTLGEKPTETFNLALSDKPVKAMDMSNLSDEELEALADQADDEAPALPEASGAE